MHFDDIILAPLVTEKSFAGAAEGQYFFKVHPNANKIEIKKAIEQIYKVKVTGVNTLKIKSKRIGAGFKKGHSPSYKKAYVKLAAGQVIEELKV